MDLIPQNATDAAMWAVIVGFLSPIALNFIVSAKWHKNTKALVALGFSAVVGTITAIIAGAYEGLGIPSTILLTAVVSITSYQNFWKQVAPMMQRDSEEKAAIDEAAKVEETVAIVTENTTANATPPLMKP